MARTAPLSAEKLLDDVLQFIELNQAKLERGEDIDLASMNDQIQELCGEVNAMRREDALLYKDRLENLFAQLSDLGNKLIHQHAAVGKQIAGLSMQRKATLAYAKSDMMDTKKDSEK